MHLEARGVCVDEGEENKNGSDEGVEDLAVKLLQRFATVLDAIFTADLHSVEAIAVVILPLSLKHP